MGMREQVILRMADVASEAISQGQDGFTAIERAFPGTPIEIITQAWLKATDAETEAWWQSVERTIEAAVIDNAVKSVGEVK